MKKKKDSGQIASRLKEARLKVGWSQRALSKASKVSFEQIHRYESGKASPNDLVLQKLATALGVPISYFRNESKSDLSNISEMDRRILSENFEKMLKLPVPEDDVKAINQMLKLVIYKWQVKSM